MRLVRNGGAKLAMLMILFALAQRKVAAQAGAPKPAAPQTSVHPAETSLAITKTNTTNTGLLVLEPTNFTVTGQGFDLGNNGTSAQGWSVFHEHYDNFTSATRGITQLDSAYFGHYAQGDTAGHYHYNVGFGGNVAASDEAMSWYVDHDNQVGYWSGALTTGGTTGSTLIAASSTACTGYCDALAGYGNYFADGGVMLDTSLGGATATIAALTNSSLGALEYTLASGTVTPSTAWGNIIPSSCKFAPNSPGNANGQFQITTSYTCNVTLASGRFNTSSHIFLNGPFQEEAAITAVGAPSGGVQSITFDTRYAWNSPKHQVLVMQGGPGGQSFVQTGAWPVAYWIVGATSSTTLLFSNCSNGYCESSSNVIRPAIELIKSGATLTRTANVVAATWIHGQNPYPAKVGSSIVVAGCATQDLNGTFTVVSNSFDAFNPSITWNQAGSNEAGGAGCRISTPPTSITFYPSAFITGTNGAHGTAMLAANTVAWASGNKILGAPTSQYQQAGINLYMGQTTSSSGSNASQGVMVNDQGPSQLTHTYVAINKPSNGVAGNMFYIEGSYANDFYLRYRPANNGTILYVQGAEPVSSNPKPYYIFADDGPGSGASIQLNPSTNVFSLTSPYGGAVNANAYQVKGSYGTSGQVLQSTGGGTAWANPRLAGTTGSIGGSALTTGTCAMGTAKIPGATVGHTVEVSASDGTLPNPLIVLSAAVTAANTVSVQLCAISAVTPVAKSYNVTSY